MLLGIPEHLHSSSLKIPIHLLFNCTLCVAGWSWDGFGIKLHGSLTMQWFGFGGRNKEGPSKSSKETSKGLSGYPEAVHFP